jgi:hypothetical protein
VSPSFKIRPRWLAAREHVAQGSVCALSISRSDKRVAGQRPFRTIEDR